MNSSTIPIAITPTLDEAVERSTPRPKDSAEIVLIVLTGILVAAGCGVIRKYLLNSIPFDNIFHYINLVFTANIQERPSTLTYEGAFLASPGHYS